MDKTVMIVDDNDFVRDSVEMFFRAEGIGVMTASNGFECLRHLEMGFKGVLLLDIQMPGMDGWETIRRIVEKDLQRDVVIVMLSAKLDTECRCPEVKKHVTAYISKPFQPSDLMKAVKQYSTKLKPEFQPAFA